MKEFGTYNLVTQINLFYVINIKNVHVVKLFNICLFFFILQVFVTMPRRREWGITTQHQFTDSE